MELHKKYTRKHVHYDHEDGYTITRNLKDYQLRAIEMSENVWDIWLVARSERVLSAFLAKHQLNWTRLDGEAYAQVSRSCAERLLDSIGCKARTVLSGAAKQAVLDRFNLPSSSSL